MEKRACGGSHRKLDAWNKLHIHTQISAKCENSIIVTNNKYLVLDVLLYKMLMLEEAEKMLETTLYISFAIACESISFSK